VGATTLSTPRNGAARARVVATFYGALLLAGFFWHAVAQDSNDVWRVDPAQGGWMLLTTLASGVALGLAIVQVFRWLQGRMGWLSELHHEFRAMLGRPSTGELVLLAAASALGEEVLFRGAMLDAWGLWVSSLVFAALHIPPQLRLWPWTASSLLIGVVFGGLTLLTGNLGAAVAAHFVINLQNLAYITRNRPPLHLRGPVRPAPPA